MRATQLLLADGRFPSGGHAHSGGLEAAVAAGRVHDLDTLAGFLRGRLATAGLVAAGFAAAAAADPSTVDELDRVLDARTPASSMRAASRQQGRALLRAGRAIWSAPARIEAHQPVALGLVAAVAGLGPADAALVAAYGAVSGPASAAVRLLGLDPYAVQRLVSALAAEIEAVSANGAGRGRYASSEPASSASGLPAASAPLLDVSAEDHASWEVRLFAS